MAFSSSAVVFLTVLCVAIRSPSPSILLPVNAFVPATNHHRRWNHCNNWSKSSSPPPRPSSSSSSLFVQLPWPQSHFEDHTQYEDDLPIQQQERIEPWSPEEVNEEPYGRRQPTSPQQQQQEYLENIVSYDTGGNSFAQPIEPSELSVGRRNGKTMYSTVGVCSTSSSSRSRRGAYRRALPKPSNPNVLSPGELTVGRTRDNGYKSNNGRRLQQQGRTQSRSVDGSILQRSTSSGRSRSGDYPRALPKQSKPDTLSPGELTVGRTRDNGYSKSTNGGGQLHRQQGNHHHQPGGGILQHYGTGAYSFSQPINPSESMTGGIRSRSDGGRPQASSFQKQEGYSGIHYIQSLQSSNADNDNDEYRNGNWASGDENNWGDHLILAAGTMK